MRNWWCFVRIGTVLTAFIYISFIGRFIDLPFMDRSASPGPSLSQNTAERIGGNAPYHFGPDDNSVALSRTLEKFAKRLAPSSKMERRIRNVITRIRKTIIGHLGKKYSIDRIVPLGSYGKKTSIWFTMDLDVTVYVDNQFPPFNDLLGDLEEAIKVGVDANCRRNKHLVKAKVDGLDVDIAPATNFVKQSVLDYENKACVQVRNALHFLRDKQVDYADYSTALTSGAVEFEKHRSSYSRTLSRLAKVWSTLVGMQDFHYGRSSLMEYLGVYAAELEMTQDVLRGFRKFLELIIHSDDLNVVWTVFYSKEEIPSSILKQRPIVLDPTNPRNNFLHGRTYAHIKAMSAYARTTLTRLDEVEKNTSLALMRIFEPQPRICDLFKYKTPCNFLVSGRHSAAELPRVETKHRADGVKPGILEDYLFAFTEVAAASIKADIDKTDHGSRNISNPGSCQTQCELTRRVMEEVRRVLGTCPGNWTSGHEDRQMTFFVPLVQDSNEYIVVGCDWVG